MTIGRNGDRIDARVICPSIEDAITLLQVRAARDAADPLWRSIGAAIRRVAPSDLEAARVVHLWCGRRARWVREDGEVFAGPRVTLALGVGDCDDLAALVYCVARGAGLRARLCIMRDKSGDPRHVVTMIHAGGRWWWAETSVPAAFGEHPIAAARRKGLAHRTGIR